MPKIRNNPGPSKGFQLLFHEFSRDPRVTPRAARLYIYLRSHEDDWETNYERISAAIGMSKSTISAAVTDLVKLGYMGEIQQVRNESGHYGEAEYVTYALPCPEKQDTDEAAGHNRVLKNGIPKNGIPKNRTYKENNPKEINLKDINPSPPSPPEGVGSNEEPEVWENLSLPIPAPDTNSPTDSPTRPEITDETPRPVTAPDRGEAEVDPVPAPSPAPRPGEGRVPDKYTPEFEDWWGRYPKRAGKRDAFKAWWKVVRTLSPTELNAHTDRYAAWVAAGGVSEVKYVPAGSKWLNGERWLDELEAPAGGKPTRPRTQYDDLLDNVWGETPPEESNPFHNDGWDPGLVIDHDAPEETP